MWQAGRKFSNSIKFILLSAFILLIPSLAQAYTETIYICQGGSGSNPTAGTCAGAYDDSVLSNGSYWSANVAADGLIGPDDLVLFLDDGGAITANLSTQEDGLSGQPITFSVPAGENVTWNTQGNGSIDITNQYITLDCADRMTINHSRGSYDRIIDVNDGGRANAADYFSLKNCNIVGVASTGSVPGAWGMVLGDDHFTITGNTWTYFEVHIFISFTGSGVHYGEISDNVFSHTNQRNDQNNYDGADLITAKSDNGYSPTRMDFSGVTISHNKFSYWGDDAIDMFGASGLTFEYNEVGPNDGRYHFGEGCNGIKLGGGSYDPGVSGYNNVARYNWIHGFSGSCTSKGIIANGAGHQIIYGNLITDMNPTSGDAVAIDLVANEVSGEGAWKVFNNTITDIDGWALRISDNEEAGTLVYNNILDGGDGDFYINSNSTEDIGGGYNCLVNSSAVVDSGGDYVGKNDIGNCDPGYNNAGAGEFWPDSNSDVIDAGANLDVVSSGKLLLPGSVWPTDVVAVDPYMDGTNREIGAYIYDGNGGVSNPVDNCPSDPAKTAPGICGCGVSDVDSDSDGIVDCNDNCPSVSNPNQADADGDGIGNACDLNNNIDTDGDGVANATDNCPGISNQNQADSDGDGIGDACDECPTNPLKTEAGINGCGITDQIFTINASAGSNGSISPAGKISVNSGDSQTYTFTPNPGYSVQDVKLNNFSLGALSSYTVTNVQSDQTVSVTFAPVLVLHTVTATVTEGGTISYKGEKQWNPGTSPRYNILPQTGYYIMDVLVDGVSVGTLNTYFFTGINASHTIHAIFAVRPTWTITSSISGNGAVSPAGDTVVMDGTSSQRYDFVPANGYHFDSLIIDGIVKKGNYTYYTFYNITADHTLVVNFVPDV